MTRHIGLSECYKEATPLRWRDHKKQLKGILRDAINLVAFLTILKLGDILVDSYWGPNAKLFESGPDSGLRMKWLFVGSDIATIACFTVRSCLRMFGIIKDEE